MMRISLFDPFRFLPVFLSSAVSLSFVAKLSAEEFDAGIALVTTADGIVELSEPNDTAEALKLHRVLELSGRKISTGKSSTCGLVLSNGAALLFGPNSSARFSTFSQRPFDSAEQSREYEPSISKIAFVIESGSVALEASHLSPLSEILITFPYGSVRTSSAHGAVIYNGEDLRIIAQEGNFVFNYPKGNAREFIAAGQIIEFSPQSAIRAEPEVRKSIETITPQTRRRIAAARYASKRVIFQVKGEGRGIPEAKLVASENWMEQPSPRPYVYKND